MAKSRLRKKNTPSAVQAASRDVGVRFGTSLANWRAWLPMSLLIAAVTLFIYWPALWGGFVWDDNWYLATNPEMRDASGLWRMWFQPGAWIDYYPLKETVQWVQWQIWGTDTFGYHLTNVVLHIAGSLLVWRVFAKLGLRLAWLGGLVFAVHPVQVDTVAAITELKNTLSTPFFLLALCRWIDFEDQRKSRDYFWALGLFIAAMLCKITMMTFPAVILLYAWWKRGRIGWGDFKASIPFGLVSLAMAVMTFIAYHGYTQSGNAEPSVTSSGGSGLLNAGRILAFYFTRVFWPVDYLPVYPRWIVNPSSSAEYLPLVFTVVAALGLWSRRKTWGRHAILGVGFFFILLGPFLDLLQLNYMSFTWVMDHILYLPMIGLIGLVVAALGDLDSRVPLVHRCLKGGVTIVVALMALESHAFANLFVNDQTLWTYTLQRFPGSFLAHQNLGTDLVEQGHVEEAIGHYQAMLALNPDNADGHYDLGIALEKMGQDAAAQEQYEEAVKLSPGDGKIYINLAGSLLKSGKRDEAMAQFEKAEKIIPDFAQLHYNLGSLYLQSREFPKAINELQRAVKLDPGLAQARENLGSALAQSGRLADAMVQFQAAVRIDSNYVIARNNLALALAQTGHLPEAIDEFQQVLAIDPGNAQAQASLDKLEKYQARQQGNGH